MEQQVDRAHARRALHQLPAAEGAVFQVTLLVAGEIRFIAHTRALPYTSSQPRKAPSFR